MIKFWHRFFGLMALGVVDGDGAGGDGVAPDDVSNVSIDDDPAPAPANPAPGDGDGDDSITIPKSEWDKVINTTAEIDREKALNSTVTDIKSRVPGFDIDLVTNGLLKLAETNPEEAESFNSAQGLENYWYRNFANAAANDPTNGGSHSAGSANFDDLLSSAKGGSSKSLDALLDMSKS